jgi:hypothetical protein
VIDATAAAVTVTAVVADLPSLVAVTVALPGATPVTTPLDDTVAIEGLSTVQVTMRSVTTTPLASFTVAASVAVKPTMRLNVAGRVTDPTATGVTVTVTVALWFSLVAVIVDVPGATPVTTPVAETVATVGVPELHATVRPERAFPSASLVVAVSVTVCPAVTLAGDGEMLTVATGTSETVRFAVPECPSLTAVIVDAPGATAVTTPVVDTVATAVLLEVHVTGRPTSTTPSASSSVGTSVSV